MAIKDKHHAFIFGIAAGVPSHELASEKVLYATDAPYEFRDQLLPRWLLAHHGWTDWDSPARVVRRDARGKLAYTWQSWEAFIDWMTATLDAALVDERHAGASEDDTTATHLAALRAGIAAAEAPLTDATRPHALKAGLEAGVPFAEPEWGYVVYLHDVPLELCRALLGWLSARFPSDPDGSTNPAFWVDEDGQVALMWARWEEFIYWLCKLLTDALDGLENAREQTEEGN
ncbi:hypothetical protein OKW43_002815 [Paraburkholderia sp. WC7.3g]|uniref:hypothetical protein n=1 Tax=Paraburkholderia sp. WC7.3g TaxID=2991070 RepID=UPI003D253B85